MYLLDTNVVSELRKAAQGRADANVVTWADSVAGSDLFLSTCPSLCGVRPCMCRIPEPNVIA
jgi:hypothetical protein